VFAPALKIILNGICENSLKLQEAIEGLAGLQKEFSGGTIAKYVTSCRLSLIKNVDQSSGWKVAGVASHVPEKFSSCLRESGYTDLEILAHYDSKIIEASVLSWAAQSSSSEFSFYQASGSQNSLNKAKEQDLIDYVLSVFYLSGFFKSEEAYGNQLTCSSLEDLKEETIIFSDELCQNANVPVYLVKRA